MAHHTLYKTCQIWSHQSLEIFRIMHVIQWEPNSRAPASYNWMNRQLDEIGWYAKKSSHSNQSQCRLCHSACNSSAAAAACFDSVIRIHSQRSQKVIFYEISTWFNAYKISFLWLYLTFMWVVPPPCVAAQFLSYHAQTHANASAPANTYYKVHNSFNVWLGANEHTEKNEEEEKKSMNGCRASASNNNKCVGK